MNSIREPVRARTSVVAVEQALLLDGSADSYVSTPSLTIPSSITLLGWFKAPLAGARVPLIGQWDNDASLDRAFEWYVDSSTSKMHFNFTTDGSTAITPDPSNNVPGIESGMWLRVSRNATTGLISYYTAQDDKETAPNSVNWVAAGTDTVATTAIHASSLAIQVGAIDGGGTSPSRLIGEIFRAVIITGADTTGAFIADMYPDRDYASSDKWLSTTSGEIWTLTGNAVIGDFSPDIVTSVLALYADDSNTGPPLNTPNTTANSIAGDLTIVAYTQLSDYSDGAIVSKTSSYSLHFSAATLLFSIAGGGGSLLTVDNPGTDGEGIWIRATFDSSAMEQAIYISVQDPTTALADLEWSTPIGTDTTLVSALITNNNEISIGGNQTSGQADIDKGYLVRVALIEDTTGVTAPTFDMYPERDTTGAATSWTSGSSSGEPWSIDAGGEIIRYSPDVPYFP